MRFRGGTSRRWSPRQAPTAPATAALQQRRLPLAGGTTRTPRHCTQGRPMASYQYVYMMKDLTKAYPGGREVFKGITLSFLPGVKIGVLGVNGAGKSTLLKIMAGIETEFGGEAWAADGVKIGYLQQEPELDATKTVGENVAEAFAEVKAALDRFNAISERFAEPMEDEEMNTLLAEQAALQEKIDAGDGWEMDRKIEIALDALRCPPPESDVT